MTNESYQYSRNPLVREGFNLRERLNVYTGAAIGAMIPIIGLKYVLSSGYDNNNLGAEAVAWLTSLVINFSPGLFSQPPIPLFGGVFGAVIGGLGASNLRDKREEKERLRRISTEVILPINLEEIAENNEELK